MRLFSYKLTSDTGFAPNPFHGACTLATCKPQIRRCKLPGDWIAGFTSAVLNGDSTGEERLVYLMQVSEKLALDSYFRDPRFRQKVPDVSAPEVVARCGDNIYQLVSGGFLQIPNPFHTPSKDQTKDLSGLFVLVAQRFFYFGSRPLYIPAEVRPRVPLRQSAHGVLTRDPVRVEAFLNHVARCGEGLHAPPTQWPVGDTSWRSK